MENNQNTSAESVGFFVEIMTDGTRRFRGLGFAWRSPGDPLSLPRKTPLPLTLGPEVSLSFQPENCLNLFWFRWPDFKVLVPVYWAFFREWIGLISLAKKRLGRITSLVSLAFFPCAMGAFKKQLTHISTVLSES